jgi:hypothetical protein
MALAMWPLMVTPEKGADTTIWAATASEVSGHSGKYFRKRIAREPSRRARDPALARPYGRRASGSPATASTPQAESTLGDYGSPKLGRRGAVYVPQEDCPIGGANVYSAAASCSQRIQAGVRGLPSATKVRRGALFGLGRYMRRSAVVGGVLVVGAIGAAAPASAAQHVHCAGSSDGCVASVSIAGGASNRTVIVSLTDTDFRRVGTRVTPSQSKGAFSIKNGHFALGGSEYIFTLNAVKANPARARIILLFAAGVAA